MAQTSYSLDHTASSAGQIATNTSPISETELDVETAAGIGMGKAVSYGTAATGAVIGGTDFAGISARSNRAGVATTNATTVAQYKPLRVLEMGRIWCPVSGAVSAGDSVAYNATTGVLTAGPAGAGEYDITGARFETAAADTENALVRLIPMATVAGS